MLGGQRPRGVDADAVTLRDTAAGEAPINVTLGALDASPASPPGETLRGRPPTYHSLAEINRGGIGAILRGIDPATRREVAIKVLLAGAHASERARRKFHVEAQVTAQLEHPNIVPVHDVSSADDGALYYAMKLVRGKSLADLLEGLRDGDPETVARWPLSRLLGVFAKVCDAMAFAHSKGVIHRDLKPDNAMIGEFGEVLVMDWGLAKVAGEPSTDGAASVDLAAMEGASDDAWRTQDGAVMGTPAYMPPEQAKGDIADVDERSDVYSLGAILYELLTFERPYDARGAYGMLAAVVEGNLVPPRERAPGRSIPHELEAIALRAMAADRTRRYASVAELRDDIERYRDGRLVAVARYGLGERVWKAVKRHALVSGAAAAAVIALTAGVFGMRWYQSEQARQLAERQRAARVALETRARAWADARGAEIAAAKTPDALDAIDVACAPDAVLPRLAALAGKLAPSVHPDERARWARAARDGLGLASLRARAARRRGDLLEAAGKPQQAFAARARAYRLDPTAREGLTAALSLGRQHLVSQRPENARRIFQTVLAHGDAALRDRALEGAGEAALALGSAADAAACFAAAGALSPRGKAIAGLAAALRGAVPIGREHYVGAVDIDGDGGRELLTLAGTALRVRRWTGGTFTDVRSIGVGSVFELSVGNVTGDSRPEIVCTRRSRGGLRTLDVLALDRPDAPLASIARVHGNLRLLDADGDGRQEIFLLGQEPHFRTSLIDPATWVARPLDPRLRSSVWALDVITLGGKRRLLAGAGAWSEFAFLTYDFAGGRARRVSTQRVGSPRRMQVCEVEPGKPVVCMILIDWVTQRVSWLLGDDLQRSLPNGVWLFEPDARGRLIPTRQLDRSAPLDSTSGQAVSDPLQIDGLHWLALKESGRRATRFLALQRPEQEAERGALLLPWADRQPVAVADLDGDGDAEVLVSRAGELVVHGLAGAPRAPGALPGPARRPPTGDARLDRVEELLAFDLVSEARELLRQTLDAERASGSDVAVRCALMLIDLDVGRRRTGPGRRARALSRIDRVVETLPRAAVPALWRAVALHGETGDLDALRATRARLARLRTAFDPLDHRRLARLDARLRGLADFTVTAAFPGEGWRGDDPLLVRPQGKAMRVTQIDRQPTRFGAPAFVDGAWRVRCRMHAPVVPYGMRIDVGLFALDPTQRSSVASIRLEGGDWSMRANIHPGNSQFAEGILEQAPVELELRYDPAGPETRLIIDQLASDGTRTRLYERATRDRRPLRGWYELGLELRQVTGTSLGGVVDIQSLTLEQRPLSRSDRNHTPPALSRQAAAVAAQALVRDADRLRAALTSSRGEAAAALLARYPALSPALRTTVRQALAGVPPQALVRRYQAAMRARKVGEALALIDAIRPRAPGDTQLQRVQLELLMALRDPVRLLAETESARLPAPWMAPYYRGRALIQLGRYTKAADALSAALELVRTTERGERRVTLLQALGYQRARAAWKARLLRSPQVPKASLERYRIDEAYERH